MGMGRGEVKEVRERISLTMIGSIRLIAIVQQELHYLEIFQADADSNSELLQLPVSMARIAVICLKAS